MSRFYSGQGDDGFTGVLGEGRLPKHHPYPETYGALDEASAALGLARANCSSPATRQLVLAVQRDLYHIMAEIAAGPGGPERFHLLSPERVGWLERQTDEIGASVELPPGFVIGGDNPASAYFDLARTVVRRAERALARLLHEGELARPHLLAYVNRLSSLCFLLSLQENQRAGINRPTPARNAGE